jgi:hypothetical protein
MFESSTEHQNVSESSVDFSQKHDNEELNTSLEQQSYVRAYQDGDVICVVSFCDEPIWFIIKMDIHDAIVGKSLSKSFVLVVTVVIVSGLGFMVGLFIRDVILEILRRCNLYDCEKGFKDMGLIWLFIIPIVAVVVCALIIIFMFRFEGRFK